MAKPILQKLNGCHEPIEQVVDTYAGEPFNRCPRQIAGDPDAQHVLMLAVDKYLEAVKHKMLTLPAKLVSAVRFTEQLLKENAR